MPTLYASDRDGEDAPAVHSQEGRVTGIAEAYEDRSLGQVSVELPGGRDGSRPMTFVLLPKKAAAHFAIGDRVKITTRVEKT